MSDRAVSEVISYVLVFALIVSAVGIVSVSGLSTLQDTRNDEQMANAERAFGVLSDNLADIYRRDAPSRATEISLGQAKLETGEQVTMTVMVNDSGGAILERSTRQLRPIIYTGDEDRQIVYEAGAVFRDPNSGGGGVRVHDPPFVISDNRVLISVVALNRSEPQAVGGSTVLIRAQNRATTVNSTVAGADVANVSVWLQGTERSTLWESYLNNAGFECNRVSDSVKCWIDDSPPETVYIVTHDIRVNIET